MNWASLDTEFNAELSTILALTHFKWLIRVKEVHVGNILTEGNRAFSLLLYELRGGIHTVWWTLGFQNAFYIRFLHGLREPATA